MEKLAPQFSMHGQRIKKNNHYFARAKYLAATLMDCFSSSFLVQPEMVV